MSFWVSMLTFFGNMDPMLQRLPIDVALSSTSVGRSKPKFPEYDLTDTAWNLV